MPNSETFSIAPIKDFVKRYLRDSKVGIDMFARNKHLVQYTNDINPETIADSHMDAAEYCTRLVGEGVKADLILFDPPYSTRQIKECYEGFGRKMEYEDTLSSWYTNVRDAFHPLVAENGVVLSFGWNSGGMGICRGYEMSEVLLVNHGGAHNDTICIAERKLLSHPDMFS